VCGPLSDLDIDWSWLKRKHHEKHSSDDSFGKKHASDDSFGEKKHQGKKNHKHHILEDDIENNPVHHSVLDDEFEVFPSITHHGGHKHHKHDSSRIDEDEEKLRKHHISSESFLSDNFDSVLDHRRSHRLPPPPPLKSTDDLEKEWKEWLIQSKNRLQHRKDDLLKTLHKESPYNEKHHTSHKLNYPSVNSFDDFDGEIFHHSHHKDHPQKKHFSPLDMSLFDRMLQHEVQKAHTKHLQRLGLSDLLESENKHNDLLDIMKSEDKKLDERLRANDLSYPMDSVDFRSAVPSHRLFLGEPSTISEIIDAEDDEDGEDERLAEDKTVVAVPFTATERLVWDWQAVALASAVAACLLFFTVVAIYSVLHARQWRRLKTNFDTDVEELSVKMGLMQSHGVGASAAEAVTTNHYLENLLEKQQQKKKNGNIYTQKRPQS